MEAYTIQEGSCFINSASHKITRKKYRGQIGFYKFGNIVYFEHKGIIMIRVSVAEID